jgi:chemotaxis signal transduction protein
VVARAGERRVILRVDRALELRSLDVCTLEHFTELPAAAALLAGVANVEDGILFIYDLTRLLTDSEGLSLDAALAAPEPEHAA